MRYFFLAKVHVYWYPYIAKQNTHRGSYMSAHVLLNLLNELRNRDKMRAACRASNIFFATGLMKSILQDHE